MHTVTYISSPSFMMTSKIKLLLSRKKNSICQVMNMLVFSYCLSFAKRKLQGMWIFYFFRFREGCCSSTHGYCSCDLDNLNPSVCVQYPVSIIKKGELQDRRKHFHCIVGVGSLCLLLVVLNSIYEIPVSTIEGNCENWKDNQQYAECKGIE